MSAHDWQNIAEKQLTRLNPYQRAVHDDALAPKGAVPRLRVLASAGSGKTNTVTTLLMTGLNRRILDPERTIVTTFTKKAAEELKLRVKRGTDPTVYARLEGARRIGTFHSIAYSWLMKHAQRSFPHRWLPGMNLDLVPDPWSDRRTEWLRGLEEDARRQGVELRGSDQTFKNPSRILDDIIGSPDHKSRDPQWKTRMYQIPELPLDIARWYKENRVEPPEEMPSGRDYALAIGVIRGYAVHPKHTPKDQVITVTHPHDEDQTLTFTGAEEVARAFGKFFGLPLLWETWRMYERIKESIRAYDFEDTLYYLWRDGTLAADLVIVDEAQDSTWIQDDLARKIAERGDGRYMKVGDIRQSIYSFRGANPALMRDSDEAHGWVTREIPTNYRSGAEIVNLGSEVCYSPSPKDAMSGTPTRATWAPGSDAIAARRVDPTVIREARLGETVIPYIPATLEAQDINRTEAFAGTIRVLNYPDAAEEARGIAAEISSVLAQGVPYEDIAILARTNAEGAFMEMGLLSLKIPALRIGRGTPFFDTKVISGALKWLAAAYGDDSSGLAEVLTNPDRGIYMKAVYPLLRGRLKGQKARVVLRSLDRDLDANKYGKPYFQDALDDLEDVAKAPWPRGIEIVIEKTVGKLTDPEDDENKAKVQVDEDSDHEALQTLMTIAHLFESYDEFLKFRERLRKEVKHYTEAQIAKMSETERAAFERERKERITISSIHGAKGLEWGWVYLTSSIGVFPSARADTKTQIAEERRLFYVGATRAKDVLTLTSASVTANGKKSGPSEFITRWAEPHLRAQRAEATPLVLEEPPHPLDLPGWARSSATADAVVWTNGAHTLCLLRSTGQGFAKPWGIYWSYAPADMNDDNDRSTMQPATDFRFNTPAEAMDTVREVAQQADKAPTPAIPALPARSLLEPGSVPAPPPEWRPSIVEYLLRFPTRTVLVTDGRMVSYASLAESLRNLPPSVPYISPAPPAASVVPVVLSWRPDPSGSAHVAGGLAFVAAHSGKTYKVEQAPGGWLAFVTDGAGTRDLRARLGRPHASDVDAKARLEKEANVEAVPAPEPKKRTPATRAPVGNTAVKHVAPPVEVPRLSDADGWRLLNERVDAVLADQPESIRDALKLTFLSEAQR